MARSNKKMDRSVIIYASAFGSVALVVLLILLVFKKTTLDDSLKSLDWITSSKSTLELLRAYLTWHLHHECSPPLLHMDVLANNVLLDDKYKVWLGSLSDACAQEGDSHQSRITQLLWLLQLSDQGSSSNNTNASSAYDGYCFRKVLLELVTGNLGKSASSSSSSSADRTINEWLDWTLPFISIYEELVINIIEPSLIIDEDLLKEVWVMAIVA